MVHGKWECQQGRQLVTICPMQFFPVRVVLALLLLAQGAWALTPYRIEVVEKGSGWPVPLVELSTVSNVRFITDNAGVVAFDLAECMGRETWLKVESPNYEFQADGFGNRGFRCTPTPGGRYRLEIARTGLARRLGRLTGSGIFGESQKLGEHGDWEESGVVGSDTVEVAPYHGRMYWAWGDTDLPAYPLGFFNAAGATTSLRPLTRFQPPLALVFDYFRKPNGQPRGVLDVKSTTPVWVSAEVTLLDAQGQEHLVCQYSRVERDMSTLETGLAEWNDAAAAFRPIHVLWTKGGASSQPIMRGGHPAFWKDPSGKEWLYLGEGLPTFRCPATYEAWKDPATWEKVETQDHLVAATDGAPVAIASGSIAWNPWRKRWVTVCQQKFGTPSAFGEVWYAEADSPAGPWGKAVKVLSHPNYTFYNVRLHQDLTPPDSPALLFEGTYTAEFADRPVRTARYNYNQILYRLDLDDPGLAPAR